MPMPGTIGATAEKQFKIGRRTSNRQPVYVRAPIMDSHSWKHVLDRE